MANSHNIQVGSKVKCVSKQHGFDKNNLLIEIGKVYTVDSIDTSDPHHPFKFTLDEINTIHRRRPFYVPEDFTVVTHGDLNDAWDRAMKGI